MPYSDEKEPVEQERLKTQERKEINKGVSFLRKREDGVQNIGEGLALGRRGFISCRKVLRREVPESCLKAAFYARV